MAQPKIRFSRNQTIMASKGIAVIWLDNYNFTEGEPVTVYYQEGSDSIGAIFAIGIASGAGRDKYTLISTETLNVINGIKSTMPDVSEVVNGERYLWKNNSSTWCLIKINSASIETKELTGDTQFKNLEDGYTYYLKSGELTREDSFTTNKFVRDYVEDTINELHKPVITSLKFKDSDIYDTNDTIQNPCFVISVSDKYGTDVTSYCIVSVTSDIHGNSESIIWKSLGTYEIQGTVTQTTVYTVNVTYDGITVHQNLTLNVVDKCFYGKISSAAASDFSKLLAEKDNLNTLLWYGDNPITFTTDLNDECTVLIVPVGSRYGTFTKIEDSNSLDYIDDYTISEHTLGNGITYRFYVKNDAVRINNFKQTFTI